MRLIKSLVLGSLALLGCNPSDFNSILDKAPVQEMGTSGSSTDSLFVLPLPAPQSTKVAARMLMSLKTSNYLALADYDMNGKVTQYRASEVESLGFPVNSAAVRLDGTVILGSPRSPGGNAPGGKVTTWSVSSKADGSPSWVPLTSPQGDGHMGISVAAGFVTGVPTGDFVAVGDNSVQLIGADPTVSPQIAKSADSCQELWLGNPSDFYAPRPVVVADLLAPDLQAGVYDEIVLGAQLAGKPGQVLFVQYNGTDVLLCPSNPSRILTNGVSNSFGTALAAGDFDGDGHMDLAVGAPPNHVYVYWGPINLGTPEAPINPTPDVDIASATGKQFGKQLSAYTMQGQATVQLMVADPDAPSSGGVGEVMIFNIVRGTATTPGTAQAIATLFDSNKDSDPGLFGLNLGGVQFNTGLCNPGGPVQLVPWATLGPSLYSFFAYSGPGAPADPRCFK